METLIQQAKVQAVVIDELEELKAQIRVETDPEKLADLKRRYNTAYHIKYRSENPDKVRQARIRRYRTNPEQDRIWRQNGINRLRDDILSHYGKTCAHCGNSDMDILILVYTGPGTDPHKMDNGGSTKRYRAIRRAGFPPGYTTLCQNCATILRKKGKFSQEEKRTSEEEALKRVDKFSRAANPHEDW